MRIFLSFLILPALLPAQPKPPTPAEFGQFENLDGARSLSPDGRWIAYGVIRSDRSQELRIVSSAGGAAKKDAYGSQAVFSADSKWAAYGIGLSEADEEKLKKDKKPIRRKLGLLELATGNRTAIDGIESFSFSPNGAYLALRRYAPEKPPAVPADPESEAPPAAATLIVRHLASGRDVTFGNVTESAWQDLPKTGRMLAIAIGTEDKTGNAVELFDPESGQLRVLDSAPATYSGLAWRKNSADLAALRSLNDDKREGEAQIALAWTHLGESREAAHRLDRAPSGLPLDLRIAAYRKPAWSSDGAFLFVGVGPWDAKPAKKESKETEQQPNVDVWHWRDADVMPKQKVDAKADRERTLLAAWRVDSAKFVRLAKSKTEQITPLKNRNLALAEDWSRYAMERSIGRPAVDLSLIDLETGSRRKIRDGVGEHPIRVSPSGRYLLFLENDHFWTVDTATGAAVNITKGIGSSFVDRESDAAVKQKPPFGVAGWTANDESVLLYDRFDIWRVSSNGAKSAKLTDGAQDMIRHRYVRLDPDEEFISLDKPLYFSLFGVWTKKSGYARMAGGREEHLLWEDKMVSRLMKAREADTLAYSSEAFEESPNYFTAGPLLRDPRKVSDLNPSLGKYAWGRSELVDYKNAAGQRLQGALYYPAGYEAGKKYPMVVYLYEKLSDGLHRFNSPSEREYYSAGAITSGGYFLLMPDIVFRPREPGVSVADCVGAAVKAVVEKGSVDAKRIGVMGHSWGGFDTTYLATHTNLFAAAVAGAPITDLISNYGNHHWHSGIAETDHIETGQQRMEVPFWEDLQAYIRNSALFNVHRMTTPLLIEVGDADGTVFFHQGVELYNAARRGGKPAVLLVYAGEDHGLRKKADQIDYHRRLMSWFAYYLKGEQPAAWITDGETYLNHQRSLKAPAPGGEAATK